MNWNPEHAPDPERWLALDPAERIRQIRAWHEAHPQPALHAAETNPAMHAGLHSAVESQLAAGEPPEVRATLERLMAEGLRRHPAVHAIMRVFVVQMHEALTASSPFDAEAYAARLRRLRSEDSIDVHGLSRMDEAEARAPEPSEEPPEG